MGKKGTIWAVLLLLGTLLGSWGCNTSEIEGCTDPNATNYNEEAMTDDGSCAYACDGMDCSQQGSCVDGTCVCNAGFYGSDCSQRYQDLWVGSFSTAESCNSGTHVYNLNVTADTSATGIIFDNLNDQAIAVNVEIDSTSMLIPVQTFGSTGLDISGSGTITSGGNQISINYTLLGTGPSEVCAATLTRN